jgi:hypothetical protein
MITLLLPLLGLIIFWFESKRQKEYERTIFKAINQIKDDKSLENGQKRALIRDFLTKHGYEVFSANIHTIYAKKKFFYLSWFFMSYGFYGLYYLWFQPPKTIQIEC